MLNCGKRNQAKNFQQAVEKAHFTADNTQLHANVLVNNQSVKLDLVLAVLSYLILHYIFIFSRLWSLTWSSAGTFGSRKCPKHSAKNKSPNCVCANSAVQCSTSVAIIVLPKSDQFIFEKMRSTRADRTGFALSIRQSAGIPSSACSPLNRALYKSLSFSPADRLYFHLLNRLFFI